MFALGTNVVTLNFGVACRSGAGGVRDVNVHCIASEEYVVTLNLVVAVQNTATLKNAVKFKMLLRLLSRRRCGCEGKTGSCAFRPWFSGGL